MNLAPDGAVPTLLHPLRRWFARSLSARIVLLFLCLLLVIQALSFFAIRASIDRNARQAIADDLLVGERIVRRLLEQNAQKLTEGASLLTADYGFRSAVISNDADTISSALSNQADRIGASVAALIDTDFKLRVADQEDLAALQPVMARLSQGDPNTRRASDVVMIDGKAFQFVLVPLRAPLVVGWVLMGFPIDQRLVDDMRSLSSMHVSLEVRRDALSPWQTTLSTLPQNATRELQGKATDFSPGRNLSVHLPDGEYSARTVGLTEPGAASVSAVLMRSVDQAVAPYRQVQLGLGILTLLGVTVFAAGSVVTARRVTTPLRRLAAAAERLGAGDYVTPLGGQARTDEIGDLAQTFERMRINVASQQAEILKLAYWDTLTGLPNRVQFRNALVEATAHAQTEGRSVAVLLLDLDRFKHVNDVLGYRFGDLMLKGVAERLSRHAVRDGDMVARLGGDQFAVLLANLETSVAPALMQSIAQRLQQVLADVISLEDHAVDMSASFGMALWPLHAPDADSLINRAEVAMYTAKRRGDGPVVYDDAIDGSSAQTLSLLSELRHALDHGELRLFLQPKLALGSGHIAGAEALMRWHHPQRGLVSPMSFIPFAEQTGFIRSLTLWMFEEAARTWRQLDDAGMRISLSINLSTRDLLDNDLPQKFASLLMQSRVPAEAFCLEITESAIMDDPTRALSTLDRLSNLGFRLSIDDFGTGYSSLAYLKRLPVDELKIDKSFVLNMETDASDARIVRSTIELAHGMGLTVVAEGVENPQVWNMLRELSCDEAQGFYMSRPIPATEFPTWCASWTARNVSLSGKGGPMESSITLH